MTRLQRVALAAAVASAGASVALFFATDDVTHGKVCVPASTVPASAQSMERRTWFVLVNDGYDPPADIGSMVKDCPPEGCDGICYDYDLSASSSSSRLFRLQGLPWFAKGWRALESTTSGQVKFFSGYKEVASACVAHFTAAQCRTFVDQVNPCWKRSANQFCRNGRLFGPKAGGSAACTPQAGDVPFPCEVMAGQKPEQLVGSDFPTDQEIDR